jgi:predicted porin
MKKLLIATAVLATFASVAQAQSSVSVYGRVGAEYLTTDTAAANSATVMNGQGTALGSSILGFRGTEDLGGGLKAMFVLEGNLQAGNGSLGTASANATQTQTFDRQSWVGISSNSFGTLKLGRTETATKKLEGIGDLGTNFFDLGADVDTYTDRFGQTISYETPSFNGFTAEITNTGSRDSTSAGGAVTEVGQEINAFNVQYKAGKLLLAAGQATSTTAAGFNAKNTLYGATYDAGFAKFEAAYQDEQVAAGDKNKLMQFGAIVPVGKSFDLRVNYSQYQDGDAGSATDIDYTGVLAVYHLSKRTQAFVGYRAASSDTATLDAKVTSVGLNHSF